jgi:holin-like protein
MEALRGFALLLLLQACGEGLARLLKLPVPGPVIGLILLLPLVHWLPVRDSVAAAANALLSNLSLFFVPAGVGVISYLGVMSNYGLRLLAVVLASTWIGLAVTALALDALLGRGRETPEAGHG